MHIDPLDVLFVVSSFVFGPVILILSFFPKARLVALLMSIFTLITFCFSGLSSHFIIAINGVYTGAMLVIASLRPATTEDLITDDGPVRTYKTPR